MVAHRSILMTALLMAVPLSGFAITPINGGLLSVTPVAINTDPGDEVDPHVGANVVSYTDIATSTVHYYDFNTSLDTAIPSAAGDIDVLSDVNQGRVAFSRVASDRHAIMVFDTTTQVLTEVDPHPGTNRFGSAGDTGLDRKRVDRIGDLSCASPMSRDTCGRNLIGVTRWSLHSRLGENELTPLVGLRGAP
jgi:hypothetical protein